MKSFEITSLLNIPELPGYLKKVEQGLQSVLPATGSSLRRPVENLISARSKRLRPCLVIAVCASQNKKIDAKVIASCVAIELVHLASLVHDDIMDNADTRWGRPTIHKQNGINTAILAGDYLFAKALEEIASVNAKEARVVAKAYAKMCIGQAREIADQFKINRTLKSYLQTISEKTGALTAAACQVGALRAGLTDGQADAFASYGEAFGMAFQLIDDVLDLVSTEELLGKPVRNDAKEGIYTMPMILALQGPDRKKIAELLKSEADGTNNNLIQFDEFIVKTIQVAQKYAENAGVSLKNFQDEPRIKGMMSLPPKYIEWALGNLRPLAK